jgi:hypothetical protein
MILPPDDQNKGFFGPLGNILKSVVRLVYDPKIIDRYADETFMAMFYEINSEKFEIAETKDNKFQIIYDYLENVEKSLRRQFYSWEIRFDQVIHFFLNYF